MAYPTAIGCGCLLGAGGMSHLLAAEWSLQPILSVAADFDSNRNLLPGIGGSEEAVLATDLRLQRSMENTSILIEPKFDLRRYSATIWGPGTDRSINTTLNWSGQKLKASFSGSIANTTTLDTERSETGIINGETRKRTSLANTELDWLENERRVTFLSASYSTSGYSGPPLIELELPGYRYVQGSLGERFILSEKFNFSVSAFGDTLTSAQAGNSSHEEGGQVGLDYQPSETNTLDLSVGESRRSLRGQTGNGTNASATGAHRFERSSVSLSYVRSLVPYGTGVLVQAQTLVASYTRSVTPTLDMTLSALRIQNDASTVNLGLGRPYYNNASAGLSWKMGESWTLQPGFSSSWSRAVGPVEATGRRGDGPSVFEWRAGLSLVWQPLPAAKSR